MKKLTKEVLVNSEIPAGKVLVKLLSSDKKDVLNNGIYVPYTFAKKDAIVIKVSKANNGTYYNRNIEKRIPINIKEGDEVLLNFISSFSKFDIDNETYITIDPETILVIYNKKFHLT